MARHTRALLFFYRYCEYVSSDPDYFQLHMMLQTGKKCFITAKYEEQVLHPKISNNIRFRIWRNGRLHAQYVALDAEVETE